MPESNIAVKMYCKTNIHITVLIVVELQQCDCVYMFKLIMLLYKLYVDT